MTADWPQMDPSTSLHAPNDIFGGDLFSDDLNDMYMSGTTDIGNLQEHVVDKNNVPATPPSGEIDHGLDGITFSDFTDLMPPEVVTVSPFSSGTTSSVSSNETVNLKNKQAAAPLSSTKQTVNVLALSSNSVMRNNSKNHNNNNNNNNHHNKINNMGTNMVAGATQLISNTVPTRIGTVMNKRAVQGKNEQATPNPLSSSCGGNPSKSSTTITPLITPSVFVVAPIPVCNMPIVYGNTLKTSKSTISKHVVTSMANAANPTSASTIYAPTRQMCNSIPPFKNIHSTTTNSATAVPTSRSLSHAYSNTPSLTTAITKGPNNADFQAVAQAAVTSLMLNAGNHIVSDHDDDNNDRVDPSSSSVSLTQTINAVAVVDQNRKKKRIDTSTAHVSALTSPNWVAACASMTSTIPGTNVTAPVVCSNNLPALEIPTPTLSSSLSSSLIFNHINNNNNNINIPQTSSTNLNNHHSMVINTEDDCTPAAKRRRQSLNPQERAKQNRDRNREHARNTRLRKKAYVEELKRTLTELVAQRDSADMERRRQIQRDLEQREVRFRVMQEFLTLRGSNEPNCARWMAIMEDGFTLTLPFTTYRSVVKGVHANAKLSPSLRKADDDNQQVLYGAPECMADATAVVNLLSSLGKGNKLNLSYDCARKGFIMDGATAVLEWSAKSVGANQNASSPVFKTHGTMKATFSPASNKLTSCELFFDTGPIINQLKKQFAPSLPSTMHDDFAANIFGGGTTTTDTDRLLDSLEMPVLPSATTNSMSQSTSLNRAVSQQNAISNTNSNNSNVPGVGNV